MPIHTLGEPPGDDRTEECAQIDAHVEQREPRIPALVASLIQGTNDRADVGLEQSRPDDDQRQAGIEGRQAVKGQREMSERDDDPADKHAAVLPQPSIGDEPTENRREPYAGDVGGIGATRMAVRESQRLGHVQDEKSPHPVIAEALPHLGEEERRETARVAEELPLVVRQSKRSSCCAESGCSIGRSRVLIRCSHFSTSK